MEVEPPRANFPSLRDLHRRRCFLLGITDAAKEASLWAEEAQRRKDAEGQQRTGRRRARRQ